MNSPTPSDSDIARPITCILSDVDGVMTDGGIIYGDKHTELKRFHVRDGIGIKAWMKSGFTFAVLTGRTSEVVAHRAAELGIEHVWQGRSDKSDAVKEMFEQIGCSPAEVCYIGDDLPDVPVMKLVGLSAAPADASADALAAADWVLHLGGGCGVVRELTERLLRAKQRWEEHLPD